MQRRQRIVRVSLASVRTMPRAQSQGRQQQRPITLVVPGAPGGATDFSVRPPA